jgi:hypothetical protein
MSSLRDTSTKKLVGAGLRAELQYALSLHRTRHVVETMSTLLNVFVLPLLSNLGLYKPRDPTYGRYLIDRSPYEATLEADQEIRVTSRRVFLEKNGKGEEVNLTQNELDSARGKDWIYYKIWEKGNGNNCDVVMLHGKSKNQYVLPSESQRKTSISGLNDYGGELSPDLLFSISS